MINMETNETKSPDIYTEQSQYANKTESAENFQKFIYELFDKNGILNDLRAYLRGHIVNVLKNSQTDEPPSCQRHFTQRLDPVFQALNMLVAEYLLCMEFSYSLSVFVSEIPLANMVFAFARSLMDLGPGEAADLRFKETDVWSILNYLGVKCDSENANKIVEMYKAQKDSPLLLCFLKCIRLHNMEPLHLYTAVSQEGSISSDSKTSDPDLQKPPENCNHYAFCQNCHFRFNRLKEKYQRKKKNFLDTVNQPNLNPMNLELVMKRIGAMERNLLEEMFDQLKSVYEAEIDMVRSEQDDRIKRSLANHALHFQARLDELEESFKAREMALEDNIEHKKRFLWGLAKALRRQHAQMTKAMQAVKAEGELFADKERSLKAQLTKAEESLKRRGEEMRKQIADELVILEKHLESMRTERASLNRKRVELDTHKCDAETNLKAIQVNEQLKIHYDLLKQEFGSLKKFLECSKLDRCVVERSTITDNAIEKVLNNVAEVTVVRDAPNKVVNDLKKQKNVNFNQCNVEMTRSRSSTSGEDLNNRLAEENDQLRRLASQQSAHISEISARAARLQAALRRRPRTAPPAFNMNATASANTCGWSKGAGEELSFSLVQSPVVLPGASVPFVGVVGQARHDRRRLLEQMRAARRASAARRTARDNNAGISMSSLPFTHNGMEEDGPNEDMFTFHASRCNLRPKSPKSTPNASQQPREKSPKSVLREAKEKLRTVPPASTTREKSPSAILREAKLRLRKLEIEAEAVERSYMDFRRRQEQRHSCSHEGPSFPKPTNEAHNEDKAAEPKSQPRDKEHDFMKIDLDKYLMKFEKEFDIGTSHFRNRNTAAEVKQPIPGAFSENKTVKCDYLEQPLTEFRRLYYMQKQPEILENTKLESDAKNSGNCENIITERHAELKQVKHDKQKELEILQQNISKIYNLPDEPTKETSEPREPKESQEKNLLRVEFENNENDLKVSVDNLLVVVASSATPTEFADSTSDVDKPPMTIIVSPKHKDTCDELQKSRSPSPEERMTQKEVFNAFLDAGDIQDTVAIQDVQLEIGGHFSGGDDYADDFSADVDNYNNKSEYEQEINSPVSFPKSSEDDNFWE